MQGTHAEPFAEAAPALHAVQIKLPPNEVVPGPQAEQTLVDDVLEYSPAAAENTTHTPTNRQITALEGANYRR